MAELALLPWGWRHGAADPLAVFEVRVAFWVPPQPHGPHNSCLLQHHLCDPADQVSASTAISFPSPWLSREASGGFRLSAYPLPDVDVPAVGLSSFQQLVTTPLPKVSISFQAVS